MPVDLKYEEWLTMNDQERSNLIRSWNPYEGEGAKILKQAFERFGKIYGNLDGIKNIHCGVYHGGSFIIGVTVQRGKRIRLPKIFEGFPVIKFFDKC